MKFPNRYGLSRKQVEVLQAFADGLCSAGVCESLQIRPGYLKALVSSACDKTGTEGRLMLVLFAIRNRLVHFDFDVKAA